MRKITLVCSVHHENESCTVGELLRILRGIGPETVFEEVRPGEFDFFRWTLEAQAIARYLESKSLKRVAVDRYGMPTNHAEMKRELERVFDYVEQTSQEYQRLIEENDDSLCKAGFNYLNSAGFAKVMTRMSEIEDQAVNETGDQGLIRVLERWRRLMQERDRDMVRNIYEYCRENVFDSGAFLVGAGHKVGIVMEIGKYVRAEADLIDWRLCL